MNTLFAIFKNTYNNNQWLIQGEGVGREVGVFTEPWRDNIKYLKLERYAFKKSVFSINFFFILGVGFAPRPLT